MPALSGIIQPDPVEYTARLGTESVTVVFDSAKMTGRWERDVRNAVNAENNDDIFDVFSRVFISWDVVDDQGQPVPLTAELLMELPSKAITALLDGMRDAGIPSDAEKNASSLSANAPLSATSEPDSPISPNGSDTSTLPLPSASPSLT